MALLARTKWMEKLVQVCEISEDREREERDRERDRRERETELCQHFFKCLDRPGNAYTTFLCKITSHKWVST